MCFAGHAPAEKDASPENRETADEAGGDKEKPTGGLGGKAS